MPLVRLHCAEARNHAAHAVHVDLAEERHPIVRMLVHVEHAYAIPCRPLEQAPLDRSAVARPHPRVVDVVLVGDGRVVHSEQELCSAGSVPYPREQEAHAFGRERVGACQVSPHHVEERARNPDGPVYRRALRCAASCCIGRSPGIVRHEYADQLRSTMRASEFQLSC